MAAERHVILLGASVGREWRIEELPERAGRPEYRLEFVARYDFDKGPELEQILSRRSGRPDAVILKECAAYFPGDLDRYRALVTSWVGRCREAGVVAIPATVAPVLVRRGWTGRVRAALRAARGRPHPRRRLEGLLAYNDWLRRFAAEEGLTVLDLEASLRVGEDDRSLPEDLHSGDGLHLNEEAYRRLDAIVPRALDRALKLAPWKAESAP